MARWHNHLSKAGLVLLVTLAFCTLVKAQEASPTPGPGPSPSYEEAMQTTANYGVGALWFIAGMVFVGACLRVVRP